MCVRMYVYICTS